MRLGAVETTLTGLVGDVKQLLAVVQAVQSRPQFDLFRIAQFVALGISIFAGTTAGITYVINAVNAESRVTAALELQFLKMRVDNGWGVGGTSAATKGDLAR